MPDYDPYIFSPQVAVNTDEDASAAPLRNATAQIFAVTDSGFTTPLTVTDASGTVNMTTITSSNSGLYPAFRCEGHTQVIAKSSDDKTLLESKYGVLLEVGLEPATVAAAIASASASAAAAAAAAASAVSAASSATGASGISGAPNVWPQEFPPTSHSHLISQLRKGTDIPLNDLVLRLLTATTPQEARAAVEAGTGNGTSNLKLGTTQNDAMPGNKAFKANEIGLNPPSGMDATDLAAAIALLWQLLQSGGGGGGAKNVFVWRYISGGWPTPPAAKGSYELVLAFGPSFPASIPAWMGSGADQAFVQIKSLGG